MLKVKISLKKDCNYFYLSDDFFEDNQSRLDYFEKNLSELRNQVVYQIVNEGNCAYKIIH